jgi:cation diffusion facilitator family transporter
MPKDRKHEFGHGKFETMATALVGIILLCVGIGLFLNGGDKILNALRGEQLPKPKMIALLGVFLSVASKEALYRITKVAGKRLNSQMVIANAWHHRSDALSSIGTAAGITGAIFLGDKWRVLDSVAALVVSVFIIKVAIELALPALNDLLERSLPEKTEKEILETINSITGVNNPHNLRTRRIGNDYAIEIHIRVDDNITVMQAHGITKDIELRLQERFGINTHTIVHVEPVGR